MLLVPVGVLSVTGAGQQAGAPAGHPQRPIIHAVELSAATTPYRMGLGQRSGNSTTEQQVAGQSEDRVQASQPPPWCHGHRRSPPAPNGSAMALTSYGYVYAWGNNQYGQAGYKTTGQGGADIYYSPLKVNVPGTATAIAMGADFGLAFNASGILYAWGYAANGELGDGKLSGNDTCAKSLGLTGKQVPEHAGQGRP